MKLSDYFEQLTNVEKEHFIKNVSIKCCIQRETVKDYLNSDREVAFENCLIISKLTNYKVTQEDLRPDIFYAHLIDE